MASETQVITTHICDICRYKTKNTKDMAFKPSETQTTIIHLRKECYYGNSGGVMDICNNCNKHILELIETIKRQANK